MKPAKPTTMAADELVAAMDRIGMSTTDLALIAGRTVRSVELYRTGAVPIPISVALVVAGMRDGHIPINWVIEYVSKAPAHK